MSTFQGWLCQSLKAYGISGSFLRTSGSDRFSTLLSRAGELSHPTGSAPIALQDESGPEVGIPVARIETQRALSRAQSGRRGQMVPPKRPIEPDHQLRRGAVLNPPQARQHPRHPGVEKAAGETHGALAADLFSERGAAAG